MEFEECASFCSAAHICIILCVKLSHVQPSYHMTGLSYLRQCVNLIIISYNLSIFWLVNFIH